MPWQHRRRSSDWRSARLAECACLVGNPFSVNPSCIELVFEYSATHVGAGNPEPLADCQLVAFEVVQLAQCVNGGVVPAGEREQRVALPDDVSLGLRAAPHDLNVAVAFRLTRSGRGRTAIAGVHGDLTNFAAAGRGEPG